MFSEEVICIKVNNKNTVEAQELSLGDCWGPWEFNMQKIRSYKDHYRVWLILLQTLRFSASLSVLCLAEREIAN